MLPNYAQGTRNRYPTPEHCKGNSNRPFRSSKNSHFQNEVKCKTFVVEMSFIYMRIKTHSNIIGFALSVALKQRLGATKQWPLFDTTD